MFLASNGTVPVSPPNFEGRLSNGRLWVEQLAERFALTLTPVQAGGTNYAYIGAKVDQDVTLPPAQGSLPIPSITSQMAAFIETIPPDPPAPPDEDDEGDDIDNDADPDALYIVFGGANDLFDLVSATCTGPDGTEVRCPVTEAEAIANRLLIAINELGAEGAVYFLVPNLPPLARTPRGMALDAESQGLLTAYTEAFNRLLAAGLDRLELDLGIIALRLDTAVTYDRIFSDPAAFGITNVSDPCLTGDSLSGGTPCSDPGTFLFWDAFRPTSAGHTAMANAALPGRVLMVETSIQAVMETAQAGDTVIVPPGLYTGTVSVTLSDVTIHASRQAVLDAAGELAGLHVGGGEITRDAQGIPQCPPVALSNFTLRGLTVRNAQQYGISFIGVDTFALFGGDYMGNGQYGIHLSCSQNGTIETVSISGHLQSAVLIGNHDNGTVNNCRLTDNGIGVEVENSANINIVDNQITGNTAGIVISAQPDMPMPATRNIDMANNTVSRNNRPLPETGRTGIFSAVPVGTGIVNLGGDNVIIGRNIGGENAVVRQNRVLRNDTLGIGILSNPFVASDPRVDPAPDNNQVRDNRSLQNAGMPDPQRGTVPSADIVYDSSGTDNCFADNLVMTVFPDTLTSGFLCP